MAVAAITPLDWTGGPALLWVLCAALLYWLGGRGRPPRPGNRWRTAAFVGGLLAILVALDSPLDGLADRALLGPHGPAPPPDRGRAAAAGAGAALESDVARPAARAAPAARPRARPGPALGAAAAGGPARRRAAPSWLIFNVTLLRLAPARPLRRRRCARHRSTRSSTSPSSRPRCSSGPGSIDSPPWRSPLSEPGKLAYLASTLLVGWMLAIVLALATSPLYSAYADEASRPWHISALTDQQLAAGVMWVPGSLAYTIAIVLIAYRLLEPRDARGERQVRQSRCRLELDEMQLSSAAVRDRRLDELLRRLLDRVPARSW